MIYFILGKRKVPRIILNSKFFSLISHNLVTLLLLINVAFLRMTLFPMIFASVVGKKLFMKFGPLSLCYDCEPLFFKYNVGLCPNNAHSLLSFFYKYKLFGVRFEPYFFVCAYV